MKQETDLTQTIWNIRDDIGGVSYEIDRATNVLKALCDELDAFGEYVRRYNSEATPKNKTALTQSAVAGFPIWNTLDTILMQILTEQNAELESQGLQLESIRKTMSTQDILKDTEESEAEQ